MTLTVAAIALAGLHFRFGAFATIGCKRATHVVALFELPFTISPDVSFIPAGID